MAKPIRVFTLGEIEPDPRPHGSLLFADPSMAQFPQHINPPIAPVGRGSTGTVTGIASMANSRVPWHDHQSTTPGSAWAAMNRKRGTVQESEEE